MVFLGSINPPREPHLLPRGAGLWALLEEGVYVLQVPDADLDLGAFLMDCPLLSSFGQLPGVPGAGGLGVQFAFTTHTCATCPLPEAPAPGEGLRSRGGRACAGAPACPALHRAASPGAPGPAPASSGPDVFSRMV